MWPLVFSQSRIGFLRWPVNWSGSELITTRNLSLKYALSFWVCEWLDGKVCLFQQLRVHEWCCLFDFFNYLAFLRCELKNLSGKHDTVHENCPDTCVMETRFVLYARGSRTVRYLTSDNIVTCEFWRLLSSEKIHKMAEQQKGGKRTVLVAVDGSEHSERAFDCKYYIRT